MNRNMHIRGLLACVALVTAIDAEAQTPVYPANFVTRLYTEGLGRAADTTSPAPGVDAFAGIRFWSREWQPGRCDKAFLKEIAAYILDPYNPGSEFNQRWGAHVPENTTYGVAAMYRALLAREPDQGGLDYWSNRIANQGYPWWAFRDGLIDSAEFQLGNYCAPADQIQNAGYVGFGQRMFHGDIPVAAPAPVPPVRLISAATVANFAAAGRVVSPTATYTSTQVQCMIDAAAAGDAPPTVALAPASLIAMDTQIVLHGGVMLTTSAGPSGWQYLQLARFVRTRGWLADAAACPRPGGGYYNRPPRSVKARNAQNQPIAYVDSMFDIRPGATIPDGRVRPNRLERVWVDGGRGSAMPIDPYYGAASNVSLFGAGAVLRDARVDNSPAATTVYSGGQVNSSEFPDCPLSPPLYTTNDAGPLQGSTYSQEISYLLITAYSSRFGLDGKGGGTQVWTDGIQVPCENALVAHNQVVDATDGGIIVFGTYQHKQQRSHVDFNAVLNAGNFAGWGIGWDPGWTRNGHPLEDASWRLTWNFNGARFSSNWIEALEHRSLAFFPLAAGAGMLWKIPRTNGEVPPYNDNQMLFVFGGGVGASSQWPKVQDNVVRGSGKVSISIHGMRDVLFSGNQVGAATRSPFVLNAGNSCPAPPPTPVVVCADDSNVCATPLAVSAASQVLAMGVFNSPGAGVAFDACLGRP